MCSSSLVERPTPRRGMAPSTPLSPGGSTRFLPSAWSSVSTACPTPSSWPARPTGRPGSSCIRPGDTTRETNDQEDPMSGTTADLLQRLQRLEDEAAIRETFYAYGASLDYGNRDQFLRCFTIDAEYTVTMRIAGVTAMEFHGHEQLAGYFDGHTHA